MTHSSRSPGPAQAGPTRLDNPAQAGPTRLDHPAIASRRRPGYSPGMRHPAPTALLLALCLLALALLPGCASMPRMLGGGSGDVTLSLDGDQGHETAIDRGQTLRLDLRDPSPKGYTLAGASFDPALLRLNGIEPLEGGRLRYLFQTLHTGQTDVIIKIRRQNQPQAPQEIFKRVSVKIEAP